MKLEKKMNRKQVEECKEAFRKYLRNNDDDEQDFQDFRSQFAEWKRSEEQ